MTRHPVSTRDRVYMRNRERRSTSVIHKVLMNPTRLLVDPSSPMPVYLSLSPALLIVLSLPFLSFSLFRFPKYPRLYLLRWIHILAPRLATRGWTRISVRWLYLGPVGANCDAVGGPTGARGREQNRNAGSRGTTGEKARRRIEIRIDPRKSSGTRPTFGYSCVHFFLSSPPFYFLFAPFLILLALFVPPPRSNPSNYPRVSPRPPRLLRFLDFHSRRNP